ncbi:MAG: hypothetical protein WDW38_001897 [Sanguina aurantia]
MCLHSRSQRPAIPPPLPLHAQAAAQAAELAAAQAKLQRREKLRKPKLRAAPAPRKPIPPLPVKAPHGAAAGGGGGGDAANLDILSRVKQRFLSADTDGSGELDPAEFTSAFMGILQTEDGGDGRALSKLFMRIDANCDGTVSWDEFSSYMLLESQGSASIREFEGSITFEAGTLSRPPNHHCHSNVMMHLAHMHLRNGSDRYVSCAKDGCVKVWNAKDLTLVKTLTTGSSWVTCTKLMPLSQTLAVASFSRSLKIFDLASYEQCGLIHDMDSAPLCMDAWVPAKRRDCEMVVLGDVGGMVRCCSVAQGSGVSGSSGCEGGQVRSLCGETPHWKVQHHTDWVTRVKYVEDLNSVLAASLDHTVSIIDVEARLPVKKLEGHHTKGVNAVDWSSIYKFVATCSQDRRIMLWNPFSQKPLAILTGHTTSVTDVIVNDRDNQIISLAADKTMKVWDIRNHKCLQTVTDREVYALGDHQVAAMAYDVPRKTLLTGNTHPKVWRQKTRGADKTAHLSPVSRVIFNSLFQEAVTGDQNGTISVWHVPSGKLRFRFYRVHGSSRLTALNFDTNKRRLITGSEDGDVRVWNFSSGACLCEMKSKSNTEVTAVTTVRGSLMRSVLAAGWDRKITFYEDSSSNKEVGPGRVIQGHSADILSMATMDGSPALATSSDDGTICTWNLESGASRRVMRAPLLETLPSNERAVEAIVFLGGRLRHILVSVGADRMMRFWNVTEGDCVLEVFTGHRMGETVQALAADPINMLIATGDSAGFMKVWDMSGFESALADSTATSAAAAATAVTPTPSRATPPSPSITPNNQQASSPPDQSQKRLNASRALAVAEAILLTSVREVALWRGHDKHVTGLDWSSCMDNVQEADAWVMDASRTPPSEQNERSAALRSVLRRQFTFGGASFQLPGTTEPNQRLGSRTRIQDPTPPDPTSVAPRPSTTPGQVQGRRGADAATKNSDPIVMSGSLRSRIQLTPAPRPTTGGRVAWTGVGAGESGGRSGAGEDVEAPLPWTHAEAGAAGSMETDRAGLSAQVALVCEASYLQRAERISTLRAQRLASMPGTPSNLGGGGGSVPSAAAAAATEHDLRSFDALSLDRDDTRMQYAHQQYTGPHDSAPSPPTTTTTTTPHTQAPAPRNPPRSDPPGDPLAGKPQRSLARHPQLQPPTSPHAVSFSGQTPHINDPHDSTPTPRSAAAAAGGGGGGGGGGGYVASLHLPPRQQRYPTEPGSPPRRLDSARSLGPGLGPGRHTEIMSDSSSDHDSDAEVPASLWLSEFSQMRRGRDPGDGGGSGAGRAVPGQDSVMRVKLTKLLGSHRVMAPGLDTGFPQAVPVTGGAGAGGGAGGGGAGGRVGGAAALALAGGVVVAGAAGGGAGRGAVAGGGEGRKRASSTAAGVRQAGGGMMAPRGGGSSSNGA